MAWRLQHDVQLLEYHPVQRMKHYVASASFLLFTFPLGQREGSGRTGFWEEGVGWSLESCNESNPNVTEPCDPQVGVYFFVFPVYSNDIFLLKSGSCRKYLTNCTGLLCSSTSLRVIF